jgi:hypothetical protein
LIFAIRPFAGREEAVEEAFAQPGDPLGYPLIFDHVNAAAEHKP